MTVKKNDKFKKRSIMNQIKNEWGYYEYEGDVVLIKNYIKDEKFNKIYQIIANGGPSIDGVYIINAYDVNIFYDNNDNKIIKILNKKYDKIAGCDDCLTHCFEREEDYFKWLKKNNFISDEDIPILQGKNITKSFLENLHKFILDS